MRRGFFSLGFLMASLMGVSILVVSAKSYASECSNNPENNYCWYGYKLSLGKYTTPRELCDVIIKDVRSTPEYPNAVLLSMTGSGNRFYCNYKVFISHPNTYSVPLSREGSSCGPDGTYNIATGECEIPAESLPRKQKGVPDTDVCGVAGNPINLSVGNKFQVEIDYSASMSPLKFIRYYNSLDGVWTHSYSSHLIIAKQGVVLVLADGRQVIFSLAGGVITPEASERGRLEKLSNGWVFYSFDNERMRFDDLGRLIFLVDALGRMQTITYASTTSAAVTDEIGNTLKFTSDELYQPKTLQVSNLSFSYTYNSQRLVKLARTVNGQTQSRTYHYGVNSQPLLLTGITDERGIRYATWTYDDQGRAISSEHANGAEKVTLSYNADGSTTVTNELGKQTVYRFQTIQGVRRITAIEGEPSANCPASNSQYSYDERGLLKTRTDNKGHLTTYTYNDRGLEVSRTEAAGTAQARTVTTEWHPDWFLPVSVTEPDRITRYTYDDQGRQLSQTVTPR